MSSCIDDPHVARITFLNYSEKITSLPTNFHYKFIKESFLQPNPLYP